MLLICSFSLHRYRTLLLIKIIGKIVDTAHFLLMFSTKFRRHLTLIYTRIEERERPINKAAPNFSSISRLDKKKMHRSLKLCGIAHKLMTSERSEKKSTSSRLVNKISATREKERE